MAAAQMITNPFPVFTDLTGEPLENGKLYIGEVNLDPVTNPVLVYYDEALTLLATQPIRTHGGYPYYQGSPANLYIAEDDFSITVKTSGNLQVFTNPSALGIADLRTELASPAGAGLVGASHDNLYASSTLGNRFKQLVFVTDDPFNASTALNETQNTAACQEALEYAESIGADLVFPPDTGAEWKIKQLFRTTSGPLAIRSVGATIRQYHDNVNSTPLGGGYKVSAAFFMKRDCGPTEIYGFTFKTNDASFPSPGAGFGSYFPSIGGQFCDNLYIHHCNFEGGQDRALFIQGTSLGLRFHDNTLVNNGLTVAAGFTANLYFYDASSSAANTFSPLAPSFKNLIFDGYNSDRSTVCAHITGCDDFTAENLKFYNMEIGSIGSNIPLRAYVGDFGITDAAGVEMPEMIGTIRDVTIRGTFTTGYQLDGLGSATQPATWTNNYRMRVQSEKIDIRGTGKGFDIQKARGWTHRDITAIVTSSPFQYQNAQHDYLVDGFYLESTTASTSNITINLNHLAGSTNGQWKSGTFVSPAGDQYTVRGDPTFSGMKMKDVTFIHGASVAGARMVLLVLNGPNNVFEDIRYDITSTVASQTLFVINGSTQTADVLFRNPQMIGSSGSAATTFSFCNPYNCRSVTIEASNRLDGAIKVEATIETRISGRIAAASSSAVSAVYLDNTGYAAAATAWLTDLNVSQGALNLPAVDVLSNNSATLNTTTIAKGLIASGNSSGVLVRQRTEGDFNYLGVFITNAGGGGTTIGVTGSAIATNMGV